MVSFGMRRSSKAVAVAVMAVVVAAWALFGPRDERTWLLFHQPQGTITSGSKLGVQVGEPWVKADGALRHRLEVGSVWWEAGRTNDEGGIGVRISQQPIL